MLSVVKLLLKGEVGVWALNNLGNYIVDHGKSYKSHGIVFLNFCGNPETLFCIFCKDKRQSSGTDVHLNLGILTCDPLI